MYKRHFHFLLAAMLLCASTSYAENMVTLPKPDMTGGKPLMQVLKERHTNRQISMKEVDIAIVSNLLWATWGINRDNGKHTAPTALNKQQIKVYLMRADGIWEYLPSGQAIRQVADKPLGAPFTDAPIHLLFAIPADDHYGPMHIGSLYQNAGLFCASAGLANVVKASTVRDQSIFGSFLPVGYVMQATQSIGWPQ